MATLQQDFPSIFWRAPAGLALTGPRLRMEQVARLHGDYLVGRALFLGRLDVTGYSKTVARDSFKP